MEDKEIKKELDKLAPILKDLREDTDLPVNYFENLRLNILAQTIEKVPVKKTRQPLFQIWKIAASFVLLLGIGIGAFTLLNHSKTQTAVLTFDDLSTTEILDYIDANISDFSAEELEVLLTAED